jgi:hypothetical protein
MIAVCAACHSIAGRTIVAGQQQLARTPQWLI